jgi:AcrR family transcriptional regulator
MADTRQQILDAAWALFVEHGFDKTSLRQVAERVGVTKAALYYYFPSKEDLLSALLEPLSQMSVSFVDDLRTDDPNRWADGLEGFIDWMVHHRDLFELIEHNEVAVMALSSDESQFPGSHALFHETVDAALANPDLPLERRVQLMCALGVSIAIAHFGRLFEIDADGDEICATTVEAMRAVLGVPARPSTTDVLSSARPAPHA